MAIKYLAGERLQGTAAERAALSGTTVTYTSDGTFTPTGAFDVEYLVVGGGGGGRTNNGGGGGAGSLRTTTGYAVTARPYTIKIGAGGSGANASTNPTGTARGRNTTFGYEGIDVDLVNDTAHWEGNVAVNTVVGEMIPSSSSLNGKTIKEISFWFYRKTSSTGVTNSDTVTLGVWNSSGALRQSFGTINVSDFPVYDTQANEYYGQRFTATYSSGLTLATDDVIGAKNDRAVDSNDWYEICQADSNVGAVGGRTIFTQGSTPSLSNPAKDIAFQVDTIFAGGGGYAGGDHSTTALQDAGDSQYGSGGGGGDRGAPDNEGEHDPLNNVTGVYGYDGGSGISSGSSGGGGGGSSAVGVDATSSKAGNGGAGTLSTLSADGSSYNYAAGGGGATQVNSGAVGLGGNSFAGDGVYSDGNGGDASGYGNGGGGGRGGSYRGGNGSQGIVVLRFAGGYTTTGNPTVLTGTAPYPNLSNGTIFEESDTGKHYMFDGTSAWNEVK